MYLPEWFPGVCLWKSVKRKSDYKKTDPSIGEGTGRKFEIKECETSGVWEKIKQGGINMKNQTERRASERNYYVDGNTVRRM